jgi:hypothetical protein
MIVGGEEEQLERVVRTPVPRRLADPAQHAVVLGLDVRVVGAAHDRLARDGEFDADGLPLPDHARAVELVVPPPAPVVLVVEAPDLHAEVAAEHVRAVRPELLDLDVLVRDLVDGVREQVLLHREVDLREQGELGTEGVEAFELDLLREQDAVPLARRLAEHVAADAREAELVLAAQRERPARDVDRERVGRAALVLALGQALAQAVGLDLVLRAGCERRSDTEQEHQERRRPTAHAPHAEPARATCLASTRAALSPIRGAMGAVLRNRLLLLAGAVALGLLLQQVLSARLEAIVVHSKSDMIAARAELALLIRAVGLIVFGMTAALGAAIAWSCRSPRTAERWPPPGVLSYGQRRVVNGPMARTLTGVGLALGLLLLAASAAGAGLVWYVGAVLLACRA